MLVVAASLWDGRVRSKPLVSVDDSDEDESVLTCCPSDTLSTRTRGDVEKGPGGLFADLHLERSSGMVLCFIKFDVVAALGKGEAIISFCLAALCCSIIFRRAAAWACVSLAERWIGGGSSGELGTGCGRASAAFE